MKKVYNIICSIGVDEVDFVGEVDDNVGVEEIVKKVCKFNNEDINVIEEEICSWLCECEVDWNEMVEGDVNNKMYNINLSEERNVFVIDSNEVVSVDGVSEKFDKLIECLYN
jgi:hypothetical protein